MSDDVDGLGAALDGDTAALLWNEGDGFHLALPKKYREGAAPEEIGVLAALAIRLIHDYFFYTEQVAWMDDQMGKTSDAN